MPSPSEDLLLAPEEIVFLICVEANRLEPQAILLCASIRRYAGRYKNVPIVAVSARAHLALSVEAQAELEALGVTYVALPLNDTGSTYGTINRIVVGEWAESTLRQPYIVVLDTDTVVVNEPRFLRADVGVRPVDMKGSATSGADDPLDRYWAQLCEFAAMPLSRLPMLRTSIDQVSIRASYNGGFAVVRRELGILKKTKDIFFASFQRALRPMAGAGLDVLASTGMVGLEAGEWWGSSQAALSVAIWSTTADVRVYDDAYNIPAHCLVDPARTWPTGPTFEPILIHYHYLAEPNYRAQFLDVMGRLGCSPDVLAWLLTQLHRFEPVKKVSVCLCTLAIHAPYRRRAHTLCLDAPNVPWVILTDEPNDFADLNVRAIAHVPTGPMAVDYLTTIRPTGNNRGAAAYHDKRFALIAALEQHDTAIFLDADSRFRQRPILASFAPGISVLPVVQRSVAQHLEVAGAWRLPAFVALAEHLTGSADILNDAFWCHESCIAITKDGRESVFFDVWGRAARFMQDREVYSGEGGVIGIAAHIAGWAVDFSAVSWLGAQLDHEGGGPKQGSAPGPAEGVEQDAGSACALQR